MTHQPTPTGQPITQLPLIGSLIDGMLESAEAQYRTLEQARPKPHVLDDATVGRVIRMFTTQRDDLWLFEGQLWRWAAENVTAAQRQEVTRLPGQVARLRQVITAILTLADELKRGTIEQVLAKRAAQLGLEVLLRRPPEEERQAGSGEAGGVG